MHTNSKYIYITVFFHCLQALCKYLFKTPTFGILRKRNNYEKNISLLRDHSRVITRKYLVIIEYIVVII